MLNFTIILKKFLGSNIKFEKFYSFFTIHKCKIAFAVELGEHGRASSGKYLIFNQNQGHPLITALLHWIHCDQNCLVTLTAFMEKRKKYRKESQLNDLEQFIWHFIVTSGTWTINMPVYRLSPLLDGHTCPMPQVQMFEKRRNFLGPPDKMLCCNDSINSDFFLSSVTTLSLVSSF